MVDKTPRYNLGVVIRETGIKPDTLRAWERRYGLPDPNRTEGGHRLYSDYDIKLIRWLIERQDEGMRISNVVQLWSSLVEEGKDPINAAKNQNVTPTENRQPAGDVTGVVISDLRERWLDACLDFDETAAEYTITQAFSVYPLETVCSEILQKGLVEIGKRWFRNEASVQQEHFASALVVRRLNALINAAPAPVRRERIILACVPEEYHSFPVLMMTLLLRYRGWHVINLGQNVPFERMHQTLQAVNADLTILCAMTLATAASLLRMARQLQSEDTILAYGGLVFERQPILTEYVPAHYLGNDLEQVPQQAESLLRQKSSPPPARQPAGEMQAALEYFQEYALHLNAEVTERMLHSPALRNYVEYVDLHLSRYLRSALAFGDLELLRYEIDDIADLIGYYGFPSDSLNDYLNLYRQVLEEHMDERGQPILDWLSSYIVQRKSK